MTDYKFVEPKTQASIRTIYIDSDTLNELKAWQSVQQQVLPDCSLVLSYNGTPTSKTTLHCLSAWAKILYLSRNV